jgi:hypothetical protein
MEYLVWFNTERPHYALEMQSPLQFLLQWTSTQQECNDRWTDTLSCYRLLPMHRMRHAAKGNP